MLAEEEDAEELYLAALGSDLQSWPWLRGRLQLAFEAIEIIVDDAG